MNIMHWLRRHKHVHTWVYGPKTVGGWGIVRCSTCGYEDLW